MTLLVEAIFFFVVMACAACIVALAVLPYLAGRLNASELPFILLSLLSLLGVPFFALCAMVIVGMRFRRASWLRRVWWIALITLAVLLLRIVPVPAGAGAQQTMNGFVEWVAELPIQPLQTAVAAASGPTPTTAPLDVSTWYIDEDTAPPAAVVPSSVVAAFVPTNVPFQVCYIPSTGATWLRFLSGRNVRVVVIDSAPSTKPQCFHDCYEWAQVRPNVWAGVMFHP